MLFPLGIFCFLQLSVFRLDKELIMQNARISILKRQIAVFTNN